MDPAGDPGSDPGILSGLVGGPEFRSSHVLHCGIFSQLEGLDIGALRPTAWNETEGGCCATAGKQLSFRDHSCASACLDPGTLQGLAW